MNKTSIVLNARLNVLCLAAVSVFIIWLAAKKEKNKVSKRTIWCRPWLRRRETGRGVLHMLNNELLYEDPELYKNFLRLSNESFELLLKLVERDIAKQDTVLRRSISARNRLEVTLRFLATGDTFRSLMYATRIHESTISRFVPEVCTAIYNHLKTDYLSTPATEEAWTNISAEFNELWQFPQCLGALDGRHIDFRPPRSDGSYYYNYKGNNSIVLLAMVDAKYRFSYVDVGVNGRVSDGGVFRESSLSKSIQNNALHFPQRQSLPGRHYKIPYVIVADDAFPLSEQIMKPFPNRGLSQPCRIFNYRLSRARRIVESAFGILANRFRVLLDPINLSAEKVEVITLACVALHNYLATNSATTYTDRSTEENNGLQKELRRIGRQGGNRSGNEARAIREEYKDFFSSPYGCVPWQEVAVTNNNI